MRIVQKKCCAIVQDPTQLSEVATITVFSTTSLKFPDLKKAKA